MAVLPERIGRIQRGSWRGPLLMVGAWCLFALAQTFASLFGEPMSLSETGFTLLYQMLTALEWAALTPFLVWVALRWDFRQRGFRALPFHVAAVAVLVPIDAWWFMVASTIGADGRWYGRVSDVVAYNSNFTLITYVAIVCIAYAIEARRREQRSHDSVMQLETQLTRAQLDVLTLQLQPHFLFNTLHAISELVHRDAEAARRMLAHLQDLLRVSFQRAREHESALGDEVSFLRSYLELQRMRFGERLAFELDIDRDLLDASVPHLLLQPIVENSIRHGLAHAGAGHIWVRVARSNDDVEIVIRDDGLGFRKNMREGRGIGATRARLAQLYGRSYSLELRPSPGGGAIVRLCMPYRVHEQRKPALVSGITEADAPVAHTPNALPIAWTPLRVVGAVALCCAAYWFIVAQKDLFFAPPELAAKRWKSWFLMDLWDAAFWLPVSLALILIIKRLPDVIDRVWQRIPVHAVVALSLGFGHFFYKKAVGLLGPRAALTNAGGINVLIWDATLYIALLAVVHAIAAQRSAAQREFAAAQTRAELARVELEALRWRMHPDFLLRALDGIGRIGARDPELADELTTRLGDLLRMMLDTAHEEQVSLRLECEWLGAFIDLVENGVAPIHVHVDIDVTQLDALVPNGVLQPLVTEAVLSMPAHPEERTLRLGAQEEHGALNVRLELPAACTVTDMTFASARATLARVRSGATLELRRGDGLLAITVTLPRAEALDTEFMQPNVEYA